MKFRHSNIARTVAGLLGWREDAHETAVLARQLDHVQATVYDVEYAERKALRFVPVDTSVPVGAKTFTYRQWDKYGMAAAIHHYANDFSKVGVLAKEFTQNVQEFGDSYEYSLHDLEAAAMAGAPLDTKLAEAARDAIEVALDHVIALGYAESNIPGFVNNPNVPLVTLPNGDWQNPSTTAAEILEDMRYLASRPHINTLERHSASTMILDSESYELVAGKPCGDNLDKTILQVFLATNPHVREVDQWTKLDTANTDGDGPRIMVYERNPRVVQAVIPRQFTQLPIQQQAAMFTAFCLARVGGCSWRHPLAAAYADNAAA